MDSTRLGAYAAVAAQRRFASVAARVAIQQVHHQDAEQVAVQQIVDRAAFDASLALARARRDVVRQVVDIRV